MDGVKEWSRHRSLRVVGLVFAALSVVILIVAMVLFNIRLGPISAASGRAEGEVIGMAGHGRGRAPIVEFTPATGHAVRFEGSFSSKPPRYRIGERVQVVYDPASPAHAFIDTFLEKWFLPFLLAMIGIPYLLVAGLILILAARGGERERRLRETGERIPGTVVALERARAGKRRANRLAVEPTGRAPEGSPHRFYSNPVIVTDPQGLVGRPVTVVIDRDDPKRYVVDLG